MRHVAPQVRHNVEEQPAEKKKSATCVQESDSGHRKIHRTLMINLEALWASLARATMGPREALKELNTYRKSPTKRPQQKSPDPQKSVSHLGPAGVAASTSPACGLLPPFLPRPNLSTDMSNPSTNATDCRELYLICPLYTRLTRQHSASTNDYPNFNCTFSHPSQVFALSFRAAKTKGSADQHFFSWTSSTLSFPTLALRTQGGRRIQRL